MKLEEGGPSGPPAVPEQQKNTDYIYSIQLYLYYIQAIIYTSRNSHTTPRVLLCLISLSTAAAMRARLVYTHAKAITSRQGVGVVHRDGVSFLSCLAKHARARVTLQLKVIAHKVGWVLTQMASAERARVSSAASGFVASAGG